VDVHAIPRARLRLGHAQREDAAVGRRVAGAAGAPHLEAGRQRFGAQGRVADHDQRRRPVARQRRRDALERRRARLGRHARQAAFEQDRVLAAPEQRARPAAAEDHLGLALGHARDLLEQRPLRARETVAPRHAGRAVEQQHHGALVFPRAGGRLRDGEPEQGGDEQQQRVGERVAEAVHEDAGARLLHRGAPEERGRDDHVPVAHLQPLQQEEAAGEQRDAGPDQRGGQELEAHGR